MCNHLCEKDIRQNLKDAGCDEAAIEEFMECYRNGEESQKLCFLQRYRKILLEKCHKDQQQLDCLDYLIYQLKGGKSSE